MALEALRVELSRQVNTGQSLWFLAQADAAALSSEGHQQRLVLVLLESLVAQASIPLCRTRQGLRQEQRVWQGLSS